MKCIFLLGGYDLEMVTIRQLLERNNIGYFDRKLHWDNAFLSAYADVLQQYNGNNGITLYGVELRNPTKVVVPVNYRLIDHHNEFGNQPASLVQVGKIIGVELTRYERLVAANDSRYIPGMVELNATKEEIGEIRRADRALQGVTEKDEEMALDAITNHLSRYGELTVVKSASSHFSPICDRLFPCRKLLVYTADEWVYYGERAGELYRKWVGEFSPGAVFTGGGENGFTGMVQDSKETIQKMVDRIINEKKLIK